MGPIGPILRSAAIFSGVRWIGPEAVPVPVDGIDGPAFDGNPMTCDCAAGEKAPHPRIANTPSAAMGLNNLEPRLFISPPTTLYLIRTLTSLDL